MKHRDTITELPLRSRLTFDGDGGATRTQSVYCPARGTTVGVRDCLECGYCPLPPMEGERTLGCVHPSARQRPAALRVLPTLRMPSASDVTTVGELMTASVVCVRPELAAESLATLLLERNISAVPVVDTAGRPVGMASKTDLVRWYHDDAGFGEAVDPDPAAIDAGMSGREVRTATVRDVMTPLAFTLNADAPVAYAAALLAIEGVHHVPIVGGRGEVVGIVAALDLVRWMARRDGFVLDT